MHRLRLLLAVATAALALGGALSPARAQEAGPVAAITATDASQPAQVRVVLEVLDAAGRPIAGLGADQFHASVQEKVAAVQQVSAGVDSGLPIDVVLAIDTSGSMAGQPLDQARTAARAFVDGLGPADRAAVLAFSDTVSLAQAFTSDHAALHAALDSLRAEGNTVLYQATADSVARAVAGASPRRAIVLLSDGVDYGGRSGVSRDQALAEATSKGVPVFTIGLGREIDEAYLSSLASSTGGRYLAAPSPDALARLYDDVGARLRAQYVLTLDTSAADFTQPLTLRVEALPPGAAAPAVAETTLPAPVTPPLPLSLTGINDGEQVQGDRVVTVAAGGVPLVSISYRLDGGAAVQVTAPFQFRLAALTDGAHRLDVEAVAADGRRASATMAFTAAAAAPGAASGGGNKTLVYLLAVVGAAALAVVVIIYIGGRRRRRLRLVAAAASVAGRTRPWEGESISVEAVDGRREEVAGLEEEEEAAEEAQRTEVPRRSGLLSLFAPVEEEPPPRFPADTLGWLVAIDGSLNGEAFPVGATPIVVGAGYRCHVRLPVEYADATAEEVRLWVRRGQLVYHRVARLQAVPEDRVGSEWLIIDPGEQFQVGRQVFHFQIEEPGEDSPSPLPGASAPAPPQAAGPDAVASGYSFELPPWRRPAPAEPPEAPSEAEGQEDQAKPSWEPIAPSQDEPQRQVTAEEFEGEDI